MMRQDRREVSKDERAEVRGQRARLNVAEDDGDYAGDLNKELLVVSSNLRPPRIDESPQRKRKKVV